MPLVEPIQLSERWFALHLGRITSSTAAMVLWKNPHDGAFAGFQQITGRRKRKTTADMQWGADNERNAVFAYEVLTGNLTDTTGFWIHPEYNWLGSSPDRLIGDNGILECKCPGVLPTAIAEHYEIQCRIHMAVLDRPWCDYLAWCGDKRTFLCRVVRDLAIERDLLARLKAFWETYIVKDTPPKKRRPKPPAQAPERAEPDGQRPGELCPTAVSPGGAGFSHQAEGI